MTENSKEKPILVVDDDSSILRVLDRYLTKKGHNIIVASNAEEALDIIKQNAHIGKILSDLKMPGMNGDDLIHEVRKMGSTIPVYIMTGFPEDDKVERLKEYDVTDIFIKPLNLHSLEKTLSQ